MLSRQLPSRIFFSFLALLVTALLALTGCGVGTANQNSGNSSTADAGSEANAEEHQSALEQAEENLRNSVSDDPASITGASTAETVAEVLPIDDPQTPQLPVTITDHQGTEVTVESADRILALDMYGTLTETVMGLGLGDNLVGRVRSSTQPSLADLPIVTAEAHDLNAEAIISLQPTVVLMDTTNGPLEITEQLRSAGITVVHFDPQRSIDQMGPQIEKVAEALGVPESGQKLKERVQTEMDSALKTISEIAPADGQKIKMAFLYVRGTSGIFFILGDGSGADDLIDALGGEDVASESGVSNMSPANSEALVKLNPDLILTMTKGIESTGGYDGFLSRPGVSDTTAGKNGRIVDMSDGQILSYGPNTPAVLLSLAQAIYGPAETTQIGQ